MIGGEMVIATIHLPPHRRVSVRWFLEGLVVAGVMGSDVDAAFVRIIRGEAECRVKVSVVPIRKKRRKV